MMSMIKANNIIYIGLESWTKASVFKSLGYSISYGLWSNPLVPSAHKSARIVNISILRLEGIVKKNSFERRDYESVDEKNLS